MTDILSRKEDRGTQHSQSPDRKPTQLSRHSGPELLTSEEILSKPCRLIPEKYLWGIQPKSEYREDDEKSVKRAIRQYGESFLREHPPAAVAIPVQDSLMLAVLDGHHRIRFSRQRSELRKNDAGLVERVAVPGVDPVPCVLLTPEQGFMAENRRRLRKNGTPLQSIEEFTRWVIASAAAAADSFSVVKPLNGLSRESTVQTYHSILIPNATLIHELSQRDFPPFIPRAYPM